LDIATHSSAAQVDDGTRLVGSAELFRRLNSRLPGWYARRWITAKEAARILGRDEATIRQQARAGALNGRRTESGWLFGIRDLSDYIASGRWRATAVNIKRWSAEELRTLRDTGTCPGRSAMAIKLKKNRMKHAGNQDHRAAL
jgi:hypothetical protein